jgi:hypothetical protein
MEFKARRSAGVRKLAAEIKITASGELESEGFKEKIEEPESAISSDTSTEKVVVTDASSEVDSNITDLEVAKKMIKISQSAADRKLEFNLTFETVKRLMRYKNCFYTNRPFGDEGGLFARSFDRIDSSKGYVEGNVVSCTVDINQKKSNLSLEEIACLYNKLVKKS